MNVNSIMYMNKLMYVQYMHVLPMYACTPVKLYTIPPILIHHMMKRFDKGKSITTWVGSDELGHLHDVTSQLKIII